MSKPIIIHISSNDIANFQKEKAAFEAAGAEFRMCQCKTGEEIVANCADADVLLFTPQKFDDSIFDNLPKLKMIVRYGIGYDTVDIDSARRHGVIVCNSPSYGAYDVAEHAFALLQTVNRKIVAYDSNMRDGHRGRTAAYNSYRLEGKQIGIIGYGRIGRYVAQFSTGFGMKIAAYDPYVNFETASPKAEPMSIDELLRTSDIVSLNTALTDETRGLMNAEKFAMMKPDAVLINTSRGGLVDEDALYDALSNRKIRAAGIDVWNDMPATADNRFCKLDNIVMTPHIAWNTIEAAEALKEEVIATVLNWIAGRPLLNDVTVARR